MQKAAQGRHARRCTSPQVDCGRIESPAGASGDQHSSGHAGLMLLTQSVHADRVQRYGDAGDAGDAGNADRA